VRQIKRKKSNSSETVPCRYWHVAGSVVMIGSVWPGLATHSKNIMPAKQTSQFQQYGLGIVAGLLVLATRVLLVLCGSQPAVQPPEGTRKHERHDQHARSKNKHVLGLSQVEASDTTDEQITNSEVEESPQHVNR
jgi:hypothetical protein